MARAAPPDAPLVTLARDAGIAVSDELLFNIGCLHPRRQMLSMGVALYGLSSPRLKRDSAMRELLGSAIGRLHAKMGFLDQRTVLVGSMNIDPRSDRMTTEIGLAFDRPALAEMIIGTFWVNELAAVQRVRFATDGPGLRWSAINAGASDEVLDTDPDTSLWQRLKAALISRLLSVALS